MARTAIRLAVVVAGAVLAAAYNPFAETWQWNQKLTVEVETPQGIKSSSAVTHVSWQEENSVGNYPASHSGEATVVEVAPGKHLFAPAALMTSSPKMQLFRFRKMQAVSPSTQHRQMQIMDRVLEDRTASRSGALRRRAAANSSVPRHMARNPAHPLNG